MKKILHRIKRSCGKILYDDIFYIILNYVVAYIPIWNVRKVLYRIFGMKIGKGTRIAMRCIVMGQKGCHGIEIGEDNVINEYVLLDGRSGLKIGNSNSISMYSKIYTGTHGTWSNTFEYVGRETQIHNNIWLGTSAIILPGSEIQDFAVIGANSLFKGVAEKKGIYVGVPAKQDATRCISTHYKLNYRSFFR